MEHSFSSLKLQFSVCSSVQVPIKVIAKDTQSIEMEESLFEKDFTEEGKGYIAALSS